VSGAVGAMCPQKRVFSAISRRFSDVTYLKISSIFWPDVPKKLNKINNNNKLNAITAKREEFEVLYLTPSHSNK
jgi:hypothetical protein